MISSIDMTAYVHFRRATFAVGAMRSPQQARRTRSRRTCRADDSAHYKSAAQRITNHGSAVHRRVHRQ
ncbi:hypothetical protein WS64_16570 [Burkholderia anthina]|uniref:Uncharacterized protein n=1 Tax=Burkholderia anthina TaxID=179879 RepID=A0AAW3PV55_9BURK|nr:hypothetical protein WS64_16570 [Burkholderia anthina]